MRTLAHTLIATAAIAAAAATADAKPRTIVVLDFDGPRALADASRSAVLNVLGDQYDFVSPKRWEQAKMTAPTRGQGQWSAASKSAGVDAVIEGWVDPQGMRTHQLTLVVRMGSTGAELDQFTERVGERGVVSPEITRDMSKHFDDILPWLDPDPFLDKSNNTPISPLDVKSASASRHAVADADDDGAGGASSSASGDDGEVHTPRCRRRAGRLRCRHDNDRNSADDDGDDGDSGNGSTGRSGHGGRARSVGFGGNGNGDGASDDAPHGDRDRDRGSRDSHDDGADDKDDKGDKDVAKKPRVSAADSPDGTDSAPMTVFGVSNDIDKAEQPVRRKLRPSPRFAVEAGLIVGTRGMTFAQNADPEYPANPPSYPSTGFYGMGFSASVFPRPLEKYGNDLTGFGVTFQLQKSIGAQLESEDMVEDVFETDDLDYTQYEGALHYRYPLGIVLLDGQINYGRDSWIFEELSPNVQIPDVSYQYVGAGVDLELAVTDRTRIGFGARYMYILDAGDVSDESWYGSGTASGLALNANFKIPLGDLLYIKGTIEYRRVAMSFNGDGNLSTTENDNSLGVSNITDSTVTGSAQIGVQF